MSPKNLKTSKNNLLIFLTHQWIAIKPRCQFETHIQQIHKSEDEFMTALLQLFGAVNPSGKNEDVSCAVKRNFLHGISDQLCHNIFIFCTNPFDDKISHQDLLKASRDALIHLSTPALAGTVNDRSIPEAVLTAGSAPEAPTST